MTNEERKAALEAIIYAADEPATIEQLTKALGEEKLAVQASLDELVESYAAEQRGVEIRAPVTSPEISEIRGVNTAGVISTLLDKHLITTAGRKEVIGRPILYKTSKEFLMRFGLSDLEELPSLKEFEALAREALGSDEGLVSVDESLTNEASIGAGQEAGSDQWPAPSKEGQDARADNEGMSEGESEGSKKAAAAE